MVVSTFRLGIRFGRHFWRHAKVFSIEDVANNDGLRRERPSCHVLHLNSVTSASSAKVRDGLDLPDEHANGQEEEEAREEDGEEYEKVDVELILPEVNRSK